MAQAKGPFRVVSVNKSSERSKRLIGRAADALKEKYIIVHVENCERIEDLQTTVKEAQPDLMLCASMWTQEELQSIKETAQANVPPIRVHALPYGLQIQHGPDAVVDHLLENLPSILDGIAARDQGPN